MVRVFVCLSSFFPSGFGGLGFRGYRVSGVSLLFGIRFRASGDVEDSTKPLGS